MGTRITPARLRAVGILAFVFGPIVGGCIAEGSGEDDESADAVRTALVMDQIVYADAAPASGWQSWSWGSTIAFANTEAPLAAGSKSQIKATITSSWGALALAHADGDLNVSDYASIAFDIRAPNASSVSLVLEPLSGSSSSASVAVPVTTTWTRKTVSLSALSGITKLGKVDFTSSKSGQIFYVDNITIKAKTAAPADAGREAAETGPDAADAAKVDSAAPDSGAKDSGATDSAAPPSSFPTAPTTPKKGTVVSVAGAAPYAIYVPNGYDATHQTPTNVLLWLHGCGGNAAGDTWTVSPGGAQDWISVSPAGRDGDCWYPDSDEPLVLGALDDVGRHYNVDPRRVVLGGYSSGGDMAYRTAFYNARRFAGLIAENTSPFRDTGSTQQESLAAAKWKLNIAHLAHLDDGTYPIADVRSETEAVRAAGFPLTRTERPGTHYDADTASSGTTYDLRRYLLPYLGAGWVAPP